MALPAVVLVAGLVLAVGAVARDQLRCVDAARAGARLAARGEDDAGVRRAVVAASPPGTWIGIGSRPAGGGMSRVRVEVRTELTVLGMSVPLSATAVADRENW